MSARTALNHIEYAGAVVLHRPWPFTACTVPHRIARLQRGRRRQTIARGAVSALERL
jgi:hypothetical protein